MQIEFWVRELSNRIVCRFLLMISIPVLPFSIVIYLPSTYWSMRKIDLKLEYDDFRHTHLTELSFAWTGNCDFICRNVALYVNVQCSNMLRLVKWKNQCTTLTVNSRSHRIELAQAKQCQMNGYRKVRCKWQILHSINLQTGFWYLDCARPVSQKLVRVHGLKCV